MAKVNYQYEKRQKELQKKRKKAEKEKLKQSRKSGQVEETQVPQESQEVQETQVAQETPAVQSPAAQTPAESALFTNQKRPKGTNTFMGWSLLDAIIFP